MRTWSPLALPLLLTLAVPLAALPALRGDDDDGGGDHRHPDACEQTATHAYRAGRQGARSDYLFKKGACTNISDHEERAECFGEALDELKEALELEEERREARLELCDLLGGGRYDPEIDPADFVKGVDHPYFPLVPGTTRIYRKVTDEGVEDVVVTATDETREILGVECIVVQDTVSMDGELVEDTLDYFAQDVEGNVWYFGEIALNFEDGDLVDIEGSWEAGRDGAKAGVVMPAMPEVDSTYRQEFLLGEAEDAAIVLALDAMADVPYGHFDPALQTLDFSPLEPDAAEHKFYGLGVGAVLEVDLESGERLELIDVMR